MYPDWPESDSDLVPLPLCEGPKLEPFDFGGPQKIEFLEHIGEGLHAHVFKVKILGQVYALKLFRFVYDDDWLGPTYDADVDDIRLMSAFYHYSEPFNCECRAYGRLHEAGHDELAIRCFGYMLLDNEHEDILMKQFDLEFNGNGNDPGAWDVRSRFSGKGGRPPPIRGIVKDLGQVDEESLSTKTARGILRDIIRIQQLGIIHLDVASRQIISGKIADFSTAITIPHFITTPELNPRLTADWIFAMEYETFLMGITCFWEFDDMVGLWNESHENRKDRISVYALPGANRPGYRTKYNFRNTPARRGVFTLVDPRLYDWKKAIEEQNLAPKAHGGRQRGAISKSRTRPRRPLHRLRLDARPHRWYYDCNDMLAARLQYSRTFSTTLEWEFKDGLIFPRVKT